MTWPALLFWVLIVVGTASDGPMLIYLFGLSGAFGTLQMLPGDVAGGANLLPQVACAAALVGKVFVQPGNPTRALAAALDPRRLGLLVAFLVYATGTAFVLPRLFAGRIELFSVTGVLTGTSLVGPSSGNVTQSCYMALSVATTVAVAVVGARADFRRHYLIAMLLGGLALVATGIADLATYAVGLGALLDPFRTVTYSLLTEAETLGSKRVVGLMSEASSYGSSCVVMLGLLTFLRPCFPRSLRRTLVPLAIVGLLVMAILSTSSSAYVGLAVFAATFAFNWAIRLGARDAPARRSLRAEAGFVVVACFALLCVYVLYPERLAPTSSLLDSTIFEKSTSASFIERGAWTEFGWRAFLDTGGLGVGVGSLRVSNWVVSILGSTGAFGGLLLFGFIGRLLVVGPRPSGALGREWQRGLRFALLPYLTMDCLIGTMPDFGVAAATMFGLLVAIASTGSREPAPTPPAGAPLEQFGLEQVR